MKAGVRQALAMTLYKYTSTRYLDSFLDGSIRFQPLTYFQQYEQNAAIGDPYEGRRVSTPPDGLLVHNQTTNERFRLPVSFLSSARAGEIFVSCFSVNYSEETALSLGYDCCVVIRNGSELARRLRRAVAREQPPSVLQHQEVAYYDHADPAGVDWALPTSMVFSKGAQYADQREYRFAFGPSQVWQPYAADQVLTNAEPVASADKPAPVRTLEIGSIRSLVKVHNFRAA